MTSTLSSSENALNDEFEQLQAHWAKLIAEHEVANTAAKQAYDNVNESTPKFQAITANLQKAVKSHDESKNDKKLHKEYMGCLSNEILALKARAGGNPPNLSKLSADQLAELLAYEFRLIHAGTLYQQIYITTTSQKTKVDKLYRRQAKIEKKLTEDDGESAKQYPKIRASTLDCLKFELKVNDFAKANALHGVIAEKAVALVAEVSRQNRASLAWVVDVLLRSLMDTRTMLYDVVLGDFRYYLKGKDTRKVREGLKKDTEEFRSWAATEADLLMKEAENIGPSAKDEKDEKEVLAGLGDMLIGASPSSSDASEGESLAGYVVV